MTGSVGVRAGDVMSWAGVCGGVGCGEVRRRGGGCVWVEGGGGGGMMGRGGWMGWGAWVEVGCESVCVGGGGV